MPLVYIADDLNSVNEAHRSLYVKDDSTGKYRLDVAGVVPSEKLKEFRDNNITLQNAVTDLNGKLDQFKDIDPVKYSEYKTKAEAFKGDQDIDKIVQQRLETATTQHRQTVQELTEKLTSTDGKLKSHLIGSEVRNAALKVGANPVAIDDVVGRAKGVFHVVNDKVVIQKEGQIVYGADGVTPMSATEWAKNLAKDAPHLFLENKGGGGGAGAMFGDKPRDKMSALEKIRAGAAAQ